MRKLLAQYSDYMPSNSVVDMLLHLENDELVTLLLDPYTHATNHTLITLTKPNSRIIVNLITDNEKDLPTLWHAKQFKY
jgi:hypothetical protein